MPLPILKTNFVTPESLIRFFHKTELEWTRHLSEESPLDVGTAMHNTQLPHSWMANRMLDAQLPEGLSPTDAVRMADEHFAARGLTCWQWVMNPSSAGERTLALINHLLSHGHRREVLDIMHMDHLPTTPIQIRAQGLTIIPARAAFKHARVLHEEGARRWRTPELADAAMMHLDDPHYDALLALTDGTPVAHVGVLAIGEIGLIEQVHVAEAFRGRGFATAMLSRAVEICARSLFKHILLSVAPDNEPAIHLYQKFGFRKVGEFVALQRVQPVS